MVYREARRAREGEIYREDSDSTRSSGSKCSRSPQRERSRHRRGSSRRADRRTRQYPEYTTERRHSRLFDITKYSDGAVSQPKYRAASNETDRIRRHHDESAKHQTKLEDDFLKAFDRLYLDTKQQDRYSYRQPADNEPS